MNNIKNENKKQLILSLVATILIVTGYFNFQNVENKNMQAKIEDEISDENIGDVELVNSEALIMENTVQNIVIQNENVIKEIESKKEEENEKESEKESEKENKKESEKINEIGNNKDSDNYFVKTRLERDNMYSRMLESYEEIVNNDKISSEQKAVAIQEISNINNYKNGIMISENLIKNKGFEDVVILINNNTVSVVVKKDNLYETDIVKIQNIIETKLGFEAKNISISNL